MTEQPGQVDFAGEAGYVPAVIEGIVREAITHLVSDRVEQATDLLLAMLDSLNTAAEKAKNDPAPSYEGAGQAPHRSDGETTPTKQPLEPPVHWPRLNPDDRDDEYETLWDWVARLQIRFPEMTRLPVCWPLHNGFVELLSALHDAELGHYAQNDTTTPAKPIESYAWVQALWQIDGALAEWTKKLTCGGERSLINDPRAHPLGIEPAAMPDEIRGRLGLKVKADND